MTLRPLRPDELDLLLRHADRGMTRERMTERIGRSG